MGGRTSSAVKNRWNAKAYDRVAVSVPKGMREEIRAHAESKGESVNGLILRLLLQDMQKEAPPKPDQPG